MWDLIVSVPDHCLSFYFPKILMKIENLKHKNFTITKAYWFLKGPLLDNVPQPSTHSCFKQSTCTFQTDKHAHFNEIG